MTGGLLKNNEAVLYNTLNGGHLKVDNNIFIIKLVRELKSKKNLYVVELPLNINLELEKFINKARELYIGDVVSGSFSTQKPVQQMPILNVQNDIKRISDKNGLNILNYISNITLILKNNSFSKNNKQFVFCHDNYNIDSEISINIIERIISMKISKLNVSGTNIFQSLKFDKLINLLKEKNLQTNFYANYQNPDISTENLIKLKNVNAKLNISVSTPIDIGNLQKNKEIIDKTAIAHNFDFKIESEQDVEVFESAINQLNIENYTFQPYYNGKNIELFEQAVYLTKEDIFEAKPTQKDIFARQVINQLNFGKLYILPDGSVYSNLNKPKLGNLNKHSIHELVHKEMYKHKNWFKLRKNVKPCRSCVYNLLCPPISNYEYAIGKYNLCHVWEEN